ncbi:UDP-2,3-diacylglucosamine diphosphatase [Marichromatium gracile]|uniref:UDP-2,3-diacylglucosamine diphosphatase n=1 Tax=Marichromatium gracile TaxID=1048 RepID=UPI001F33F122|nr:UDP-2,3-diacylglucosamine diphosphatase [Marichromatium gracile]MCF1184413.1 UDP-2,3-diacylglucosamine diphosphatase [Marichromatium gracile]
MDETLFVSDVHLSPQRPELTRLFLGLLAGRARGAERLYILGDLFDAWIGDDDDEPLHREVAAALAALTAAGTRCFIQHGNRDFLIGRRFARASGCRLIGDPHPITLDGERVILMHGDLLCTDDLAYQRFRRRVRNPLVRRLFLWRSLAWRKALAADYRRRSAAANADKSAAIMDVTETTVVRYLRRHRATRLIHGHTHRPADHRLTLAGRPALRMVLADWDERGGELLVHRPGSGFHREPLRPAD